jgi:hypothetical protein
MKRYKPRTHRLGFAMAAMAMMVITVGLFVVVPAELDFDGKIFGRGETSLAA